MAQKVLTVDFSKVYETKRGEQYRIIEDLGLHKLTNGKRLSMCKIKFINSGYEKVISTTFAMSGKTSDPYFIDAYGVGYMGEIKRGSFDERVLDTWHSMLSRCYYKNDTSYIRYGAMGVIVCDRWHCFANFYEDYRHLPGYQNYVGDLIINKANYHLDKDLLQYSMNKENKVYSPETCCLLSNITNVKLVNNYVNNDETQAIFEIVQNKLIGVIRKPNRYYEAAIITDILTPGIDILFKLGSFDDMKAAIDMYDYFAGRMNMPVNKPYMYYTLIEMLSHRAVKEPIFLPMKVAINNEAFSGIDIIFGSNSIYNGVLMVRPDYCEAYYIDQLKNRISLGFYDSDVKAAYVYNTKCKEENRLLHTLNPISKQMVQHLYMNMPHGLSALYTTEERSRGKAYKTCMLPAFKYRIGQHLTLKNGDEIEIIDIADEAIRTSYTKVLMKIRFVNTGYETIIVSRTLDNNDNIKDHYKRTICGIAFQGGEFVQSEINTRLYRTWTGMIGEICKFYPNDPESHIDSNWLNFLNFLKDAPSLEGFRDFENNIRGYVLNNLKYQYNIPFENRVYNNNTCTFMPMHLEEKYKSAADPSLPWYGVFDLGNNTYKVNIRHLPENVNNGKLSFIYSNKEAAANIVNLYCETFFGIRPIQNVRYMPYNECVKYRICSQNTYRPIYHLVHRIQDVPMVSYNMNTTINMDNKRPIYHLNNISLEERRKRSIAAFGIDLTDDGI